MRILLITKKKKKHFEFILVDIGSIEVEHKLNDKSDSDSVTYSKVTIKKILSPFEWKADHLQYTY